VRRTAILGDVGGHYGAFASALTSLGIPVETALVPDDLTIIQLGDLVHKGPDSDAVVALADRLLSSNGDRYVQLLGNHEAEHFAGPAFSPCNCSVRTIDTLRGWTRAGLLRVAASVESMEYGRILVTHAGITSTWYHDRLATPPTAAEALNHWWADPEYRPALVEAGEMLRTRDGSRGSAGPLWASERELVSSWSGRQLPYSQVHGHDAGGPDHTVHHLLGGTIIGIDPGFGARKPSWPLTPLVLVTPQPQGTT
jgi:hypothetical protein